MPDKEPVAASSPYQTPWLLLAAIAVFAGGGVAVALWFGWPGQPGVGPSGGRLDGKLTVLVRPPDRNVEPVSVEEPGAVPVQTGGAMCLDAQLNQPAFVYFVWLDSAGNVLPLYPWNNERLEVTDINEPPPVRRATKLVFSPLLGSNWTFGEGAGTEVVLLLARRTPLPTDIKLAELLTPLACESQQTSKVTILGLDGGAKSVAVLLPAASAARPQTLAAADPLGRLILRLGQHFELVRAARFAHE
jgi:hypothetical protein